MRSEIIKGVFATLLGAAIIGGAILARPAAAQENLPDGAGRDILVGGCSGCHGLGQIVGEHRNAQQWSDTVTAMINNGAQVPEADMDKLVTYLATNFGDGSAPPATPAAGATMPPAGGTAPAPNPPAPAQ